MLAVVIDEDVIVVVAKVVVPVKELLPVKTLLALKYARVLLLVRSLTEMLEVLHVPPVTFTKPVHPEEFCPVPP